MTAARRERKALRRRLIVAWLSTALIAVAGYAPAVLVVVPSHAATAELVVTNRHTGLAIDGFDPVSYFIDAEPALGRAEWEMRSGSATWRFRNEGNRAAFAAAPGVYAPRFGGYDPTAVARGAAAAGNPHYWLIAGQRLYLFYDENSRASFARNPDAVIEPAERHWRDVEATLVHY